MRKAKSKKQNAAATGIRSSGCRGQGRAKNSGISLRDEITSSRAGQRQQPPPPRAGPRAFLSVDVCICTRGRGGARLVTHGLCAHMHSRCARTHFSARTHKYERV